MKLLHFRLKTAQEELDLVMSQLRGKQEKLLSITSKVHLESCDPL